MYAIMKDNNLKVKRNYKVGDLVTIKNGDGEKFKVSMLCALGISLEDMEGSSIRSVFNPEQLVPLVTKN